MKNSDGKVLIDGFENPGSVYRGAPFWAWNGKLEPEELRRQIRLMHEMGLGGFFMHSRVGLGTAYLSDEWFDCVKACIDEAEKLDMQAWLYDEDRWPSGAGGGLVTSDPQYRARKVESNVVAADAASGFKPTGEVLAVFAGKVDRHRVSGLRRVDSLQAKLKSGESFLHFQVVTDDCSPWFNGQTYLDTLNPDAVKKFIEVTHEVYRKKIGKTFGKRVPGIFTDEPHYGHNVCQHRGGECYRNPWTAKLAATFRSRYGYELVDHLPELFFDVEGVKFSRARLNYIDCITTMFVDAFARQVGEWCEKNNLMFTGHVLMEDTLRQQTEAVGSAMRFYEHMQAPGMDLLTEHWLVYETAKQVTSAARQFDRKWRLTETYGCTGWDFPFSGHKALGDWQAALGINVRCQHLAWYTMAAEAKRDYPAAIFYQSPWYRDYKQVEDYFARINLAMTQGKEVRDLLVIHPIESSWTMIRREWRDAVETDEYDFRLVALRNCLLTSGIDFDFGDEELMTRHTRLVRENGQAVLYVGKAAYRVVVVPELITVRASTLELLRKFVAMGGKVVCVGKPAEYVDGLASAQAAELAAVCDRVGKIGPALVKAVESPARRVRITDGQGKDVAPALHLLREDAQSDYLFICNTGKKPEDGGMQHAGMVRERKKQYPEVEVCIRTEKKGAVLELDPETGRIYRARAEKTADGWRIKTSLAELGSRMFVVQAVASGKYPSRPQLETVKAKELAPAAWNIRLSEDNVVVFDRFGWQVNGGAMKPSQYVLAIDDELRKLVGVPARGGAMVQPWAQSRHPGKALRVKIAAGFDCRRLPSGPLFVGLETPERFEVRVNGCKLINDSECGWWCDRSLRKLPVGPEMLRCGHNEITLEGDYDGTHPGLEMVYLLGNFGTELKGLQTTLVAAPETLRIGDWVRQGLTFYAGSTIYSAPAKAALQKGERLFVTIPDYRGVALRILVDGVPVGMIAWPPQELDITDYVGNGKFELGVEVVGSRRNSHGPFYCKDKWPSWTGPGQFKEELTPGYQLVPCGLMRPPVLEVRREKS